MPKRADGVVRFSTMPEGHLGYAVTWGSMSAAMALLAARLLKRGK